MTKFFCFAIRTGLCFSVLAVMSAGAPAAIITLNIDASQSNLSLGGTAFGLAYTAQGPNALTTSLSGSLTADLTAGVFTFSGGSGIVVDTNLNGPFTTAPNAAGVIAGNFGVTGAGVLPAPFGDTIINGVYRDLTLDITAGSAQDGLAMAGGVLKFTGGELIFGAATAVGNQTGVSNITASGGNTAGTPFSWDGTTLTMPLLFVTTGSNRVESWDGVIVARVIPEPSSFLLVSLVSLSSLIRRRRPLI